MGYLVNRANCKGPYVLNSLLNKAGVFRCPGYGNLIMGKAARL